jgi:hypothetical protein
MSEARTVATTEGGRARRKNERTRIEFQKLDDVPPAVDTRTFFLPIRMDLTKH